MDISEFLSTRRSTPIKDIGTPGPDSTQLEKILQIGLRVPDHGKLNPWYLLVFTGEARAQAGQAVRTIFARKNPDAPEEQLKIEENRFLRAPVVVAVVSRLREGKTPAWEQRLSSGLVAYNLCMAAQAQGFAANWLTEWMAYDAGVQAALGLEEKRDRIAGFVYIGTQLKKPEDRDRPDVAQVVTHWQPGVTPNKCDIYNRDGFGLPSD